ncbi:ABC transporter substrate-binding protein [Paenibacillus tianmuensis]|uniref:ABC transporter substrate-binding protein n=1 Tax=Paenibacillus tianmuensis TaxID=624147 RepID=UPI001C26CC63|nr:ABC transporter substrate-binding protein [Paenibacillus tianmuensis]
MIVLLLAACSKQTNNSIQPTRAFEHEAGVTEVPVQPLRVASDQHMGHLLKLGVKPIAVRENMLKEAWIPYANLERDALEGIENLGGFPLNLEKLASLEPDLIISALPNNHESYSKIAPTVRIPYWSKSYTTPMDKLLKIAELFDKTAEANKWIKEFEGQLKDAQQKIAASGKLKEGQTVSVMAVFDKNVFVFGPNGAYGGYMIYDYLKLKPTDKAETLRDKEMGSAELSFEAVPEYMGDHAFITVVNEDKAKELLDSNFWKSIPAVMNDQVYFYDSKIFAMDDPYSLEAQLNIIVNLLTKAR